MEWTADVTCGDWIAAAVDDPWRGTIHDVVPRGFPTYARVLHPVTRERPVGRDWPADADTAGWEALLADPPQIDVESVTWQQVADAFGTHMHPLAQWSHLIRIDLHADSFGPPRDGAGWRYDDPREGQLDAAAWTTLARVLARHTGTPGDGGVAVWEGWGGLTGGMGYGQSRVLLEADADPQHAAFLAHAARDVFNDVFRMPTWQPGILSDEISRGPRLHLPDRDFVLFRGGVAELADPGWPSRVPWSARVGDGFPPEAEAPGIVWPADRAWVAVSEIDYDSTIIGGTSGLIADLLATSGLDVVPLPHDADLSGDADDVDGTT